MKKKRKLFSNDGCVSRKKKYEECVTCAIYSVLWCPSQGSYNIENVENNISVELYEKRLRFVGIPHPDATVNRVI